MKPRGVAANSAFALAGDVASKAGALLVVLLAARLFSVGEFAAAATALACAGLLASALDLGSATLITRDGARSADARGALFRALLEARVPLALGALLVVPIAGALLGDALTALAVVALALAGALGLSVLGVYRASRDIRPEAAQRLVAAGLAVVSVALCSMLAPRADALIAALAVTTLVTLVPLVLRLPAAGGRGRRVSARSALRQAAPIGLLALATVAYYRSGTIVLAAVAGASETAAFSVAASVAFALLMLPNAITTALLPRLALERDPVRLAVRARRAIGWTLAIALPLTAVAAAVVPFALPRLLGPEYARAGLPFVLLCVGIPLIAASGVIGTALLAAGHVRDLAVQVACSLLVNLVVLVLLAPPLGAIGASLATVACEIAGLLLLLRAASRALPGLVALRPLSPRRRVEAPGVVGL